MRIEVNDIREGRRAGERILRPIRADGTTDFYASTYLAVYRHRPENTLRADVAAIALLEAIAGLFYIPRWECRTSYEEGLTDEEFHSLGYGLKLKEGDLKCLAERKNAGASIFDLNSHSEKLDAASVQTQRVRASGAVKYLEVLMKSGDAALSRCFVSDATVAARRHAASMIRASIVPPKLRGRANRSKLDPCGLAQLEQF